MLNAKAVSGVMLILLIVSLASLAYEIQVVGTSPATITVPDDYPTIEEAINHANAGDTVFVRNGIRIWTSTATTQSTCVTLA